MKEKTYKHQLSAKNKIIDQLKGCLVYEFDGDEIPSFVQGDQKPNELLTLVTAERCRAMVSIITVLREQNEKLTSMCRAAGKEISDHWDAHCDKDGYGPRNLLSRLEGKLPPDLYSTEAFNNEASAKEKDNG